MRGFPSLCRPSCLAEPDPVLLHFRALFRWRVAAAGGIFLRARLRAPTHFGAVVGIISHFIGRLPCQHLGHGKLPRAAVRARIADAAFLDAPCVVLLDLGLGLFGAPAVHHEQFGVAHDLLGQAVQHIDGDDEAHVAGGRGVILPRADGLKNRRAAGHGDDAAGVLAEIRLAVVHRGHAGLDLLHQGIQGGLVSLLGIKASGVDELGQPGVEIVGGELILLQGKGGEAGVVDQFVIGECPQSARGLADQGPESLEARPGAFDVGEQEGAFPEALAGDRVVRLGIDGQQDARAVRRLRHPFNQHQHMAVGIGIDRSRPERLPAERDGIQIRGLVLKPGPRRARMDGIRQLPADIPEAGLRADAVGEFGLDGGRATMRRRFGRATPAGAEGDWQADLPGKISPQGVGQVGAIGC